MMKPEENFIEQLLGYCNEDGRGRAELAVLRRGVTGEARDLARVYPLVLPLAPWEPERQRAYIETACLFGLHPTAQKDIDRAVSLAQAMHSMSERSESIEARFIALLQCHREELAIHLRHCVALARSNVVPIPLRWNDILRALQYWSRGSQQKRWAREFWTPRAPEGERGDLAGATSSA